MNKKTKLLSVFLLAGAVGAGAAGIAGCKDNHVHNYSYEDLGNGKHHVTCTDCNEEFDEDHNNARVSAGNGKHHLACIDCGVVSGDDESHYGLDDDVCDGCNAEYVVEEFACDFTNPAVASFNGSSAKTTQNISLGKFTIGTGVYVEGSGAGLKLAKGDVNTQQKDKAVIFTVGGDFNKNQISFQFKGAVGNVIKLCKSNGTVVKQWTLTEAEGSYTVGYNFTNNTAGDVTLSAGEYYLGSGQSLRIGDLKVKEYLENAPVTKIEAVPGKTQYKVNDTLDISGLVVNAEKANGAIVPLNASDYTTNASSIDMSTAGEKTVTVTYTANPSITTTFKINVISVSGVSVNAEFMQKVYIKGASALDTANLVVYAQLGSATNTEKVASGSYTIDSSSYNLNAAGEYNVKITYNGYNEYVKITVIESAIQAVNGQVTVSVNEKHSGLEGEEVGGVKTFKSIGNAIDYLEASNLAATVIKKVEVQPGKYREKITTNLDNLTLIGTGTDVDETELVYNVVEAMTDPVSGSLWSLRAATLTVNGVGFKAYNIKISNDFDYIKDHSKWSGGPQGLALRIGGDQAVIYNCHLFGNQDTLYVYSGRAYFYETQIDGNVDFIFGENKGTAYFEKCVINVISRENGKEEGCVTAWKGEGADFNCVFNDCEFKATDCADQSVSLGRPWGANASVIFMNSSFTSAYSKYAYGSATNGYKSRYQDMSGHLPADANFVEIDCSGAGAISESIAGCTVGGDASDYTKEKVFVRVNGNVTWASDWDCDTELENLKIIAGLKQGDITQNPNITVSFKDIASSTDLDTHINGLFTYTGTIKWNDKGDTADGVEIAAGTIIEFEQAGRVAIEWYSNATYGNPKHIILEYIEGGKARITALQKTYINGITLNTADVPEKSASHTITYNYNDGETPNGTASVIDGNYLQKPADPDRDGYTFVAWHIDTVDGTVYNFDSPVTGALTLVAEWQEGEPDTSPITENTTITFGSAGDYTSYVNRGIMTLTGDWQENGADLIKTNHGTTIRIKADKTMTVTISWHNNGNPTDENRTITYDDENGEFVITVIAEGDLNGRFYMYSVTLTVAE